MAHKKRRKLEDYDGPLNVVLYIRVSTEEQAVDGFSLDNQFERLTAYCKAQNYNIVGVFREEGESGRTIKRPEYQAMMEQIEFWEGIVVMKIDRIHRNSRNFMSMMDELRARNKHFISMTEHLDTSTAMGRFVMDIIQRIAQLESEQTGERTYAGMEQKAITPETGILGFNAPFGYEFEDGELTVVSDEARCVRGMFDAKIKGKTIQKIVEIMNQKGIKTKKGNPWTTWSIGYILKNVIYAGYLNWDGHITKGTHKTIITVDAFNKAQKGRRRPVFIEEA